MPVVVAAEALDAGALDAGALDAGAVAGAFVAGALAGVFFAAGDFVAGAFLAGVADAGAFLAGAFFAAGAFLAGVFFAGAFFAGPVVVDDAGRLVAIRVSSTTCREGPGQMSWRTLAAPLQRVSEHRTTHRYRAGTRRNRGRRVQRRQPKRRVRLSPVPSKKAVIASSSSSIETASLTALSSSSMKRSLGTSVA